MKIGILGGSFDPIHIGHLIIGQEAAFALNLDRVLFMPLNRSVNKIPSASPLHRREMVKLAITGNPLFALDARELERGGITYSIDSVQELKRESPDNEFFFILGTDAYNSLLTWKNAEKLIKLVKFVLYNRKGAKRESMDWQGLSLIEMTGPFVDVSSSMIRERVKKAVRKSC